MELAVLIGGKIAGSLDLRSDEPVFRYETSYMARHATPLSVRFPLAAGGAAGKELRWWLEGLIPDDVDTIRGLRREYGLHSQDLLRLLGTPMGADCAGAVQFCPFDQADQLAARKGGQTPISEAEIADWLRRIQSDPARRAYRSVGADSGFSLTGVQPKVAVRRKPDGGWAVPHGAVPTTHIIKATRADTFPHEAIIEHLVMETAARTGLVAARTAVDVYDGLEVIVVERFDRLSDGNRRIHQEDLCQALGFHPHRKYQYEDGPSPKMIAELLRRADPANANADIARFCDSLLYLWLAASIDGHAKNYSIMHPGPGSVRLSPLYDVSSWLPYRQDQPIHIFRLAMKMGEDYPIASADQPSALRLTADRLGLNAEAVAQRAIELATAIPAALNQAINALPTRMASEPYIEVLHAELTTRATSCQTIAAKALHEARPPPAPND